MSEPQSLPPTELVLGGLHHLTAVTARAADNVAFYTQTLGLRLVKQTVNQDDVSAYHLFYGDALGHAGTEVTFFDWSQIAANRPGTGEVAAIALRVPSAAALAWWAERFDRLGVRHGAVTERAGRRTLAFTDAEGQRLELVEDGGLAGGTPWARSPVPAEQAIRGLHAVTLVVRRLEPTARVLTQVLGMRRLTPDGAPAPAPAAPTGGQRGASTAAAAGEAPAPAQAVVFAMGQGGPGAEVRVEVRPELPPARLGYGGVHHVAFRTPDDATHHAWRERIAGFGIPVTPAIDRYYFRSLYFREPGGILFEIATDGPGFATNEDPEHLGERLALPPFLEPQRAEIEAGLKPLRLPSEIAGR